MIWASNRSRRRWRGRCCDWRMPLVWDCVQTEWARAPPSLHTLPGEALAEQEMSGERVHMLEGTWQKEPRFPRASGPCHKAEGSHALPGADRGVSVLFPMGRALTQCQVRFPGWHGAGVGSLVSLWGLGQARLQGELSSGLFWAEMSAETLEEEGSSLAAVYTLLGLNLNHTGFLYMVSWQLRDQIWFKRNDSSR